MADELLDSLLVPSQGGYIPASTALKQAKASQNNMAAAVASQHSSQDLALRNRDPAFDSMDAFTPPRSAQGFNDENLPPLAEISGFGAMANPQDIADFDRENPYDPLAKRPRLIPLSSSKGNTANTVKFQHLCDQHAYRPIFTFPEMLWGYTAKVEFGSHTVTVDDMYQSKKPAKEAVCKLAILHLPELDRKGTKRKSSDTAGGTSEVDKSENWIGLLHENAQLKNEPMPEYQEYQTDSYPIQFGCTITIAGGPIFPFGADLGPFRSKQDAKVVAAKEAVLWLRGAGLLQTPVKRQKPNTRPGHHLLSDRTGLTQAVGGFDIDTEKSDSPSSLPQQVHNLVAALGFRQPRWDLQRSSTYSGEVPATGVLFDMAAHFNEEDVAAEPKLAGSIGKVERIYGKKNAKEECCKKVLPLLKEIQRSRSP